MTLRLLLFAFTLYSGIVKAQIVDITTIGVGNSPNEAERYEKKDNPLLALEDNFVLGFPLFFNLKELEQLKTIQISLANLMK